MKVNKMKITKSQNRKNDNIENEKAKFSITGNGHIHVKSSDIIKSRKAKKQFKTLLKK